MQINCISWKKWLPPIENNPGEQKIRKVRTGRGEHLAYRVSNMPPRQKLKYKCFAPHIKVLILHYPVNHPST